MESITHYGEGAPLPAGTALTVSAMLDGQRVTALNGGPAYRLNPAFSFVVDCADQAEVDYYWERLGEGGTPVQCGWLTGRFGLSWQVVPNSLGTLLGDPDP
ncbi:MAG: VOC family protein [Chloroflexota bacterium]